MISKLLSLLSTAKGVAAATVIAAAGVTGGVAATNPDVQNAIGTAVENVTHATSTAAPSPSVIASSSPKASPSGQPAVVAARNDADQRLRNAFQADQQTLAKLHDTKVDGSARQQLESLLNNADAKLRARETKALDDIAALTLGRDGRVALPAPSGSPAASPSASPTATPAPSPSAGPSASPSGRPSGSPEMRATFTAGPQVDAIVTAAIADMATIVSDAEKAADALPTTAPGGKPSDQPGVKPSDVPSGKRSDQPSATSGARPSETPDARPSSLPSAVPSR